MAPIAFCFLALFLITATAQTTQHLVAVPQWCMRTNASEATGEVWAEMALCRWNNHFQMGAPASDQTIRFGDGLCLNGGGSEGAFFDSCDEGQPLQKWEFVPAGATAETLSTPDSPDNVPGQVVLASADANTIRPKMCLKGNPYDPHEGERVTTVQCDSMVSRQTTWTYAPPPPANKVLLVMPARHAAGETACVQMTNTAYYPQLGDCGDEDLVGNWWVREGDLIRTAAGGQCLWSQGSYVELRGCDPDSDYERWSLSADGALKRTTRPEDGCVTYMGSEGDEPFFMKTCTGDSMQAFAFVSAAPSADAAQVV